MNVMKGDLLRLARAGKFDAIVHGCNCFCTMGAGIARQIQVNFPEAYAADCATEYGDRKKMGTISKANIARNGMNLVVINAYTQYHFSAHKQQTDYDAVRQAMRLIKKEFSGQRIGYPKIGAGLGRGNWDIISRIIDEELHGEDHTLVVFESTS